MQITVTFNSLNELKAFTEKVLVGDTGSSVDLRAATEEPDQQTPVQKRRYEAILMTAMVKSKRSKTTEIC